MISRFCCERWCSCSISRSSAAPRKNTCNWCSLSLMGMSIFKAYKHAHKNIQTFTQVHKVVQLLDLSKQRSISQVGDYYWNEYAHSHTRKGLRAHPSVMPAFFFTLLSSSAFIFVCLISLIFFSLPFLCVFSWLVLQQHSEMNKWIREAANKNIFLVFLIIDSPNNKDSILQTQVCELIHCGRDISSFSSSFLYCFYLT